MAWDFAAEIHSLANYNADDASTTGTSGEVLSAHATQWLTDGAKEVINNLPATLIRLCTSIVTFTANSTAAGSESETLNTGKVYSVFAGNKNCRLISSADKYKAEDIGDIIYATIDDPAYYTEANKINVLPAGISNSTIKYEEVAYPTVAFDDTAIANFPDEAEHVVVLYASIQACLYNLNTFQSDDLIDDASTGALSLVNRALDRINTYNWADSDTFDTAAAQLTRVKNALNNAESLINGNQPSTTTDAFGALANEDVEIMSGALSLASTELNRASAHLSEWSALSGVAVQEAQGFIAEANARIGRANQKYSWYSDQYAKISAEYARSLASINGA